MLMMRVGPGHRMKGHPADAHDARGAWPSQEGDTQLTLMMRAGLGHRMKEDSWPLHALDAYHDAGVAMASASGECCLQMT